MYRIGFGYDVHRLCENRKLVLGGVIIPHNLGLLGHSDADVVIHAIIDALLGSLCLGDIGTHFPDNDVQYENIDSRVLLVKVYQLIKKQNYCINNLDITICAEKPKLSGYITQMREVISNDLECSIMKISVKATTEENLGVSADEKGISAHCVVLLKENEV
jgi:2-C-methyl-D-erythritol 2,4-cyclodiphosphate synthase